MIRIDDKLISQDVFERQFACDLGACQGACCVQGDAGAPLEDEECDILDEIYPQVAPYLSEASRQSIEAQGHWVENEDYLETPLLDGKECAYVVFEEGMALCGIEMAWKDKKTDFQKPISCHLYPIRVSKLGSINVEALNYDKWSICSDACDNGKRLGLPVFRFLKAPLIRKYGEEFYWELEEISVALATEKKK